jgi:hypothetical protein
MALGAGGSATAARIRRLIAAPAPIGRGRTAAGILTVAAMAALPLVLLGSLAAVLRGMHYCPHTVAAAPAPGNCGTALHC